MSDLSFDDTTAAFAGKTDTELKKARWLFRLMGNGAVVDLGGHLTRFALRVGLPVHSLVKQTIYSQFCGGETLAETTPTIDKLWAQGVSTILDYGVEAKETEEDFERVVSEQLRAIAFADRNPAVPYISLKITAYAPMDLLEKVSEERALSADEQAAWGRLEARMTRIGDAALASDVALYVDAEESWIQPAVDGLVERLMQRYNQQKPVIFTTAQLYRHDRLAFLRDALRKAQEGGYILGVKLVRGAYMEKERERARRLGYPSPIHADKAAVDRDYDAALLLCLDNLGRVAFCNATHNEDSSRLLAQAVIDRGLDRRHPHLHFAQLYGMGDHITFNLTKAGFNASKYVPYGPVRDTIPYLIRRAEENRSISGQVGRELRLVQEEIRRREAAAR